MQNRHSKFTPAEITSYLSAYDDLYALRKKRPLLREEIEQLLLTISGIQSRHEHRASCLVQLIPILNNISNFIKSPNDENATDFQAMIEKLDGCGFYEPLFETNISDLINNLVFLHLFVILLALTGLGVVITSVPLILCHMWLKKNNEPINKERNHLLCDLQYLQNSSILFKQQEKIYYVVGEPITISRMPIKEKPPYYLHVKDTDKLCEHIYASEIMKSFPETGDVFCFEKFSHARAWASYINTNVDTCPAIFRVTVKERIDTANSIVETIPNKTNKNLQERSMISVKAYRLPVNKVKPRRAAIYHQFPEATFGEIFGPINCASQYGEIAERREYAKPPKIK